jgi:hypothetical protein
MTRGDDVTRAVAVIKVFFDVRKDYPALFLHAVKEGIDVPIASEYRTRDTRMLCLDDHLASSDKKQSVSQGVMPQMTSIVTFESRDSILPMRGCEQIQGLRSWGICIGEARIGQNGRLQCVINLVHFVALQRSGIWTFRLPDCMILLRYQPPGWPGGMTLTWPKYCS